MRKITNRQAYLFCDQLAMIVKSGVFMIDGLDAILSETDDQDLSEAISRVKEGIRERGSLYLGLEKAAVFDPYMMELVKIGEKAGYLENVLSSLSDYYLRMDGMQQKIKDAILYPGILIVTMVVVIGIIVFKVLPIFQSVFQSLGTDLSVYALGLMEFGQQLAQYGLAASGLIIAATLSTILIYRSRYHEKALIMFLTQFFITRRFMYEMAVAQFAYAFSLLIKSGYSVEEALDFVEGIVINRKLSRLIKQCRQAMNDGESFQSAILRLFLFKGIYAQMIVLGMKIGKLDETMVRIADQYEEEVNRSVDQFLDRIEPSLTAVMALIVGVILLSVMLPLLSIMSSIG